MTILRLKASVVLLLAATTLTHAADPLGNAENLIVVTLDGTRWQEVFGGIDRKLVVDKPKRPYDVVAVRNMYMRESKEDERENLMPFLWNVVAKQGQIFGDRSANCIAEVSNPYRFSYPGYSEMTLGYVDERINSNNFGPNPNPSVYEWLNGRPGLHDNVAVFAAWSVIGDVINPKRSGVYVTAGWSPATPYHGEPLSPGQLARNEVLKLQTRASADAPPDVFPRLAAIDCLKLNHPRVLWVALEEPDAYGHANRYDQYLHGIQQGDAMIRDLWETAQSIPQYAGKTALLITTDHGRGTELNTWTSHGKDIDGANGIWVAVMGPNTPALGVREECHVVQGQIAATIASLIGQDYRAAQAKAAEPLPGVVQKLP